MVTPKGRFKKVTPEHPKGPKGHSRTSKRFQKVTPEHPKGPKGRQLSLCAVWSHFVHHSLEPGVLHVLVHVDHAHVQAVHVKTTSMSHPVNGQMTRPTSLLFSRSMFRHGPVHGQKYGLYYFSTLTFFLFSPSDRSRSCLVIARPRHLKFR